MTGRESWKKILDAEVQRWSAMPYDALASALSESQVYEVALDSKQYQVEVELLENTEDYLQVYVGVDDGSLPASIVPVSGTVICRRPAPDG